MDIAQNKTSENTSRVLSLCARIETDGYICFIPMETRHADYTYVCVCVYCIENPCKKKPHVIKPYVLAVVLFALPEVNEYCPFLLPFLQHWQPGFFLIFFHSGGTHIAC